MLATSTNDVIMKQIISKTGIGNTSDSAIDSMLNAFITNVKNLVRKNRVA